MMLRKRTGAFADGDRTVLDRPIEKQAVARLQAEFLPGMPVDHLPFEHEKKLVARMLEDVFGRIDFLLLDRHQVRLEVLREGEPEGETLVAVTDLRSAAVDGLSLRLFDQHGARDRVFRVEKASDMHTEGRGHAGERGDRAGDFAILDLRELALRQPDLPRHLVERDVALGTERPDAFSDLGFD